MRRTTTVAAASAAVLCLGSLVAGCGSTADEGYVAVGAAGPADGRAPSRAVPPEGGVVLTPLDGGDGRGGGSSSARGHGKSGGGSVRSGTARTESAGRGTGDEAGGTGEPGSPGTTGAPRGPSAPPAGTHTGHGHGGGPTPPASPSAPNSPTRPGGSTPPHGSPAPEPPSPTIPAGPGAPGGLLIGRPALAGTDVRWCQQVSLDFLNNGDRPVTAGTVTFGTHVIGALGIDWATLTSTRALPLPLAVGRKQTGTWRVCVDSWRVPLGMHLDTKDVRFTWK
ncbi:hypothetical protein OG436_20795 [Streptomyces caniferus]|uniref:hypothetical protein n=1 Tax=Streptomyces caniferus TaxID=285557 RepID=UPI002E2CA48E|nr:hypothetical protein [Streptomyces caniferus]